MKLSEIAEILNASVLSGNEFLERDFQHVRASDLMSDILARTAENYLLLTGLVTLQTIRTALIAGISAIVIVRGKIPPEDVIQMARNEGIPLLATSFPMFVSCGRLFAKGMTGLGGTV